MDYIALARQYKKPLVAMLVLLIIVIIIATFMQRRDPSYTIEYVDKDTGETVSIKPNVTPENYNSNSNVTVLGAKDLGSFGVAGLVPNQVGVFTNDLTSVALPKLGEHDEIIKVMNASYDQENDKTRADLKLSKKRTLNIIVSVRNVDTFSYTVSEEGHILYESGDLSVTRQETYTGDGTPPEDRP